MTATDRHSLRLLKTAAILVVLLIARCENINRTQPDDTNDRLKKCNVTSSPPIESPHIYTTPQEGNLIAFTKYFSIYPLYEENAQLATCELDVRVLMDQVLDTSVTSILYIHILCPESPQHVHLNNPSEFHLGKSISYLSLQNCDMFWSDIALFSEAADLRVLYLHNSRDLFLEEKNNPNTVFFSDKNSDDDNATFPLSLPGQLDKIGTFLLVNTGRNITLNFPRILREYSWPEMAEITLINVDMDGVPEAQLSITMPNLQAIEIKNSPTIVALPQMFPWTPDTYFLPRSLTRTANFNSHYGPTFVVRNNVYRRVIDYSNTNITGLDQFHFHGLLDHVALKGCQITAVSDDLFANVSGLQHIDLSFNVISSIPPRLLSGLNHLIQLNLDHNRLLSISEDAFRDVPSLQVLGLDSNQLQRIEADTFIHLPALQFLNLSHNSLVFISDTAADMESGSLQSIIFRNNQLSHLPIWALFLRNCVQMDFSHNLLNSSSIFDLLINIDVHYFTVQHRWSASTFNLKAIPNRQKRLLLNDNAIRNFPTEKLNQTTKDTLLRFLYFFNVHLDGNPVVCDCNVFNLYRLLHLAKTTPFYNSFNGENWICTEPREVRGKPLATVDNTTFRCPIEVDDCPAGCICYLRSVDQLLQVDCGATNRTTLPDVIPSDTKHLSMQNTNLSELNHPPSYLASLDMLDLSFANVSQVSDDFANVLAELQEVHLDHNRMVYFPLVFDTLVYETKTLTLGQNPIRCDCHSKWAKDWLLALGNTLIDRDYIVCASGKGQGNPLIEVRLEDFICEDSFNGPLRILTGVFAVTLGITITITILSYVFGNELKVFLFVFFKWHPFDKSEEVDDHSIYDAVVSYSSKDYRWVCHVLRQKLEAEGNNFRLCIQDRDFMPGASIEESILDSVKQSRRMIMVLSRSFLESDWCMLHFRAAHLKVLKDQSKYLILVMYDDISPNEVDDNLRLYIKTNSFVSIRAKWFWSKLRYAMPEVPIQEIISSREQLHRPAIESSEIQAQPKQSEELILSMESLSSTTAAAAAAREVNRTNLSQAVTSISTKETQDSGFIEA